MEEIVQKFFTEAKKAFLFLESCGYRYQSENLEHPDEYRDSQAVVKFISETVVVEISWYFAGAAIGVAFVETENRKIPAKRVFFG